MSLCQILGVVDFKRLNNRIINNQNESASKAHHVKFFHVSYHFWQDDLKGFSLKQILTEGVH